MITVFYDGKCSYCAKEIAYYQRIQPKNVFEWKDIANHPTLLDDEPFTHEEALMYLHVRDHNNTLQIGIDAFIAIWKELPKWRFLGKIAGFPVIHGCLSVVYRLFCRWRFKGIDYCQIPKDKR